MKLTTEVQIPAYSYQITPEARGLIIGSCFATNIGAKLLMSGLNVVENPQGILYNPLSIANGVEILKCGTQFDQSDLVYRDGLWHSFAHHGRFSDQDPGKVLEMINRSDESAFHYIILTLGTAWIYEREGGVVANCHKFPEREFQRRRISVEESLEALRRVRTSYPEAFILLTVSPIRHLRDGLSENSLSKATLRLSCEEFCARDNHAAYFPAYEIMMDELRDYRFYGPDMLHPTPLAVDIIFSRFADALLSSRAVDMIKMGEKRSRATAHRPLH